MCEVDVFGLLRFCDEFSHVVSKRFSCNLNSLLRSHVDGIDILGHLHKRFKCHIYHAVVNNG